MDGSAAWELPDSEEEEQLQVSRPGRNGHRFPAALRAVRDGQLAAARPGESTPPGPGSPAGGILALCAVEGGVPCGRSGADSWRPGLGGVRPLCPAAAGANAPAFMQYLNAAAGAGPVCYQILALGTLGDDDDFVKDGQAASLLSLADAY